jgi:hypothetical protein
MQAPMGMMQQQQQPMGMMMQQQQQQQQPMGMMVRILLCYFASVRLFLICHAPRLRLYACMRACVLVQLLQQQQPQQQGGGQIGSFF